MKNGRQARPAGGAPQNRRPATGRSPRPVRADKPRRRHRRGNYILYYILIMLLLAVTGVVLSLTVFFKIGAITIKGTDKYPADEMRQKTGISIGDNLFRANLKQARANLMQYPYVADVKLTRNYPPEIVVQITEEVAAAALQQGSGYTLVSADGRILEENAQLPEGVIPITGVTFEGQPGDYPAVAPKDADDAAREKADDAAEVVRMIQYLNDALRDSGLTIQSADFSDSFNIVVRYSDDITIEFGSESELTRKMKFARKVIDTQLEDGFKGVLYADTVGKVWADPDNQDSLGIPDNYVYDEATGTYVDPNANVESGDWQAASDSGEEADSSAAQDAEQSAVSAE